ncbi:hypothetical protein Tco_0793541 [Tanacetum coccineum]
MTESPFVDSGFAVLVFSPEMIQLLVSIKQWFLSACASSRFPSTNNQLRTSYNPRNQATIQDGRVTVQQVQGRQGKNYSGTTFKANTPFKLNNAKGKHEVTRALVVEGVGIKTWVVKVEVQDPGIPSGQAQTIIHHNAALQTEDLDTYDSDCDDLSNAQAVLWQHSSNLCSDIISEVPNSETYLNDMDNQSVHALQDFKQSPVMDFTDNEISSDSNIILYSQYLQETQQATVQDTNLQANKEQNNKTITAELERYKERVKTFEQRLNIDLSSLFKNESKEKENKYMENEIDLEKKIKELDNIICKVGQSAQTVHMLTKPRAFYDNTQKQALGYQNPFYLKKAQRIKPTLYDGVVMSNTHVVMPVIDDEETLILEEEIRSKMSKKAKDLEVIAKKISHKHYRL